MGNIYKFLERVSQMDRFIQAQQVTMKRSDVDENQTQLLMDVVLFNLERKKIAKAGA